MKINCPAHEDRTPSLHVYEDGGFCFVCGYRCSLEELDVDPEIVRKEPTDVGAEIQRINSLPRRGIRGLELPVDSSGFYIVWPGMDFYKKRWFRGDVRYTGPRGIRPPLFTYPGSDKSVLIIVEGEMNAMSLKQAFPDTTATIASPGSASELLRHLYDYLNYSYTYAIVDYDPAGVVNGVALKDELLRRGKRVELITLKQDFNDVLVSRGVNGVKEVCQKEGLEM